MKIIGMVLIFGVGTAIGICRLHAQQTAASANISSVSATDEQVMLQAVETVAPVPFANIPQSQRNGTFWSAQHPPDSASAWPPLPGNIFNLPVWSLGDGHYIIDDLEVNYAAIAVLAASVAPTPMVTMAAPSGVMMPMFSMISGSSGTPVYLTNLVATLTNGGTTVSFSIAGGTNGFAYDIYGTTNLLNTPIYSQWTWLGQGYSTNRYTFTNQPLGYAFYILAIPRQTMVVGWGANVYGQSDAPVELTNAVDVAGGFNFSLALKADGTVAAWGNNTYGETNIPAGLTNVTSLAAGGNFALALRQDGTIAVWGGNGSGQTNIPAGLTNVMGIAAGNAFSMALESNGTVVAWGNDAEGQTNVPALGPVRQISAGFYHGAALLTNGTVAVWGISGGLLNSNFYSYGITNVPIGLSNVVAIACGGYHTLALKADGTVVAWGCGTTNTAPPDYENYGQSIVPTGLSNVVAVAGGGYFSMALRADGTIVEWGGGGYGEENWPDRLTGVKAIAAGGFHSLVIRSGQFTPLIFEEPADQYAIAGTTVTFSSEGEGVAGVGYQWQFEGMNIVGATGASLTLTNVQAANEGAYQVIISDSAGSVVSDGANFYLVTPPVITSQTLPTNQICIYGNTLSFAATATAPYQANGFPLSYQWQWNGTNLPGATTTNYSFTVNDNSSGVYSLSVSNAAGSTNVTWWVTVTNAINVTNDLLLIYNTNSQDSTTVLNYYLAHRPGVGGANVLGIGCLGYYISNAPATSIFTGLTNVIDYETILPTDFTNQILNPVQSWLAANPAKRPQYVVLFPDIPSRVNTNINPAQFESGGTLPSVQYQLYSGTVAGWNPFVTSINMNGTNDCIGYINKLAAIGTNFIVGSPVLSASAAGYNNTNWYFDGVNSPSGVQLALQALQGVMSNGIALSAIDYASVTNSTHIASGTNVVGYYTTGTDGGPPYNYSSTVIFQGNSSWYIMETVDSLNGHRYFTQQGIFIQWFSAIAFGGTNYSNTPIGAVSHVDEPGVYADMPNVYYNLWSAGNNFAVCAWISRHTLYFQAVGDPFVVK